MAQAFHSMAADFREGASQKQERQERQVETASLLRDLVSEVMWFFWSKQVSGPGQTQGEGE